MNIPSLTFGGSIPQIYEDLLGPFLFEPFANDLAGRIDVSDIENVLELACGSGRVTRHVAKKLPSGVNFIASDLSPQMINVAQTKVDALNVNWAVVDMLNIPYGDESFDLVICQFGVMLVPDHEKALAEIFRILKRGGRVLFNTWAAIDYNPLWRIANDVLKRFVASNPMTLSPGPFAMSDEQAVIKQLEQAGFTTSKAISVRNTGSTESAADAAKGVICGLPVLLFIQQQAPELLPEIISAYEEELINQLGDHPMLAPQSAWVFEARK